MPFGNKKIETAASVARGNAVHPGLNGSRTLGLAGLLLIPLVGLGHYATGTEISFAVFYLPPLAMAAWFGGRIFSCFAGIEIAIVWFAADEARMGHWAHPTIHYWSILVRVLIYTAIALLLALLRERRDELELAVQCKTELLQQETAERSRAEREILEISNREQRRFAYDLHDGLGQQLAAVKLRAELLQEKLNGTETAQEAAAIVGLVKKAAREIQMTARTLNGPEIGDLNIALQKLAASVKKVRVHYRNGFDASPPVSASVAVHLYRIAQEAVRNAIEHAAPTEVQIDLSPKDGYVMLRIRDDGRGFDSARGSNGMGLRIMQYRAQRVNGWCGVASETGRGTTVTCRVPRVSAGTIHARVRGQRNERKSMHAS
jgi:signal transduction histidine kinase